MFIIAVCVLLLTEQSLCETDPKSGAPNEDIVQNHLT